MKLGLPMSICFHALLAFGGLLLWSGGVEPLANMRIIPLELVTVSDISDIKALRRKHENPIPDDKNIISDTPDTTINPPDPETAQDTPAPVFDLDALEEAFEKVRKSNPGAATQQDLVNETHNGELAERARQGVGARTDVVVNAKDYIRSRLKNCWLVDTGALDYQNLVVEVMLNLNEDASIEQIVILNNADIIASSNRAWRVARNQAKTALIKCAPYQGLLTIDYRVWKQLYLNLDPGENE